MIDLAQEISWTPERIAYGYYQQSLALPGLNRAASSINFGEVYRLKLKSSKTGIYRCENRAGQEAQHFEIPDFSSPLQPKDAARVVLEQEMKRYVKEAPDSPYLIAPSHGITRRQQMGLPTVPLCTTRRLLSTRKHFPGIHSTYAYISSGPSFTPTHKEDFGLQSVNILYRGCPKIWVVIAPRHSHMLEANLIKKNFSCSQSIRHLNVMPAPSTLEGWGIDFKVVMQQPGEFVGTDYDVYHYVWNLGPNIAEAVNFCGSKWFPPPAYVPCHPSMGCPGDIHITTKDMQIGRPRHLDAIEDEITDSADSQHEVMDEVEMKDAKEEQHQTEASDGKEVDILDPEEADVKEGKATTKEKPVDSEDDEDDSEVESPSPSSSTASSFFSSPSPCSEEEEDQGHGKEEELGREEFQRQHVQWKKQEFEEDMLMGETGENEQGQKTHLYGWDSSYPPDDFLLKDDIGETLLSTKDDSGNSSYAMIDIDRRPTVEDCPDENDLPHMSIATQTHFPMLSRLPSRSSYDEENNCLDSGTSEPVLTSPDIGGRQTRSATLTMLSPQTHAAKVIHLDKTEQTSQNVDDFDSGLGEELSITSSPGKLQSYPSMQSDTPEALVQEVLPYLDLFEWPSGDSRPGTTKALTTLCKENWLDDRVISELLIKLTSDTDSVRFIDPCHLQRRFEASDLSVLPPLENCRLLLAPFWVGCHWFLISVDFARSRMVCHDANSRPNEIEYMQKAIRLEVNHDIIWQLVESDKTIPKDGNNCGVYLLAQAQCIIDESFCPPHNPMELRLHFTKMLLGPTLRRLEMQPNRYPSSVHHQPTTSRKRPRLYFDEHDALKRKADILEMVYAVGSPAVFADLAVVIQSATTESCSDMRPVEMAMQSYTTAGADMVASKITRIHACMIVQERFTELATKHRHQLKTNRRLRRALKRQGSAVSQENTAGKDARHLALIDIVSEWRGIPSSEVQDGQNYSKQRRAVEAAKKIGEHCLDLQKHWEDQPLWSLIPHRPVLTVTGSSLIDAESYKSLSREEAKLFIKELKSLRPLFWQNIQKLSAGLLRCIQLKRDAPRVKLHNLDPDTIRTQQIDSEMLLHCLDDTEAEED